LWGSFAAAQAHLANGQGDAGSAAKHARRALDFLSGSGDFACSLRSLATSLLGDASRAQGDLGAARQAYLDAARIGQAAGNRHMELVAKTSLAGVLYEQGRLYQAAGLYEETLALSIQADGPDSPYTQEGNFGLSQVWYAWDHLDRAAAAIEQCRRVAELWRNASLPAACLALAARLELASGQAGKAQASAEEAEAWAKAHSLSPHWAMWIETTLARLWLDLGRLEPAFRLLGRVGLLPQAAAPDRQTLASVCLEGPVSYRVEPACLVLARLCLALDRPGDALALCERLDEPARVGGREQARAELCVLMALAYQRQKDAGSALAALEEAIRLAWPEQNRRVFLDEGRRIGKLLYAAAARGAGGPFAVELLSSIDRPSPGEEAPCQEPPVDGASRPGESLLAEPLSPRELEILRCLAEGNTNHEIAGRFVLSPKTVKRHLSNIFAKLEAKNRTQAVALARALKLLE
jgi:LuxR family maltose regulon positive regulatory protein